ncbi:hypothetical protein ABZU86_12120 [Streptomyces sp. NPDC005271]|uniref:hypothetical protein n=1 Tax=Streptomyces sp. NPDC005271 TaxID=3157030 RepID=UPI0033A8E6EC
MSHPTRHRGVALPPRLKGMEGAPVAAVATLLIASLAVSGGLAAPARRHHERDARHRLQR